MAVLRPAEGHAWWAPGCAAPAAAALRALALLAGLLAAWQWLDPALLLGSPPCRPLVTSGGVASGEAAGGGTASPSWPRNGTDVHVLFTSNGGPYQNYLTLALYGTFLRAQRMPGGASMVALTRILHRSEDDELSPVLPTFRATPAHPECDGREAEANRRWTAACRYPVADRPMAVRQFFDAGRRDPSLIQAPWLYLVETDYVFVRPTLAPGPAEDPAVRPLGFLFPNVAPAAPRHKELLVQRLYPPGLGPIAAVPQTGPSPILARAGEWEALLPRWEGLAAQIEADEELVKTLDWVREMYAFSFAAAVERIPLLLQTGGVSPLITHPPARLFLGNATALHYTFVSTIRWAGNSSVVWAFNKRDWTRQRFMEEVPPVPLPPPYRDDWVAPGPHKPPLTREAWEFFTLLASTFNSGLEEVGGPRWREVLGQRQQQEQRRLLAAAGG